MAVDFGRTASDYARYRAGFPDRFFDRLFHDRVVAKGDRVLDVGTGTGTVARGLALRGCAVTGLDPSRALLEQAKNLDREAGVEILYVESTAEQTGLPSGSLDVVTAGQCWHWFEPDKAAAEAHRLLAPRGRLVIAHFDWLPLPGNVVEATEKLIKQHNPEWKLSGGRGVYSRWLGDVAIAGFENIETFSFDVFTPYSHEAW